MKTDKTFTNVMAWTNVQVRNYAGPTEYYSIFDSLSAAQDYAAARGAYAETPVAYEGQIIAAPNEAGKMTIYVLTKVEGEDRLIPAGVNVWDSVADLEAAALSSSAIPVGYTAVAINEKDEQALYIVVEEDGVKTVKPVGTKVVADNKTLSVDTEGIIGLVGTEELLSTNTYTPKFVGGKLEWFDTAKTPDPNDLSIIVAEHERRLDHIEDVEIPRLDGRVDDEISARKAADEELSAAISAHIVSCETADEELSNAIDNIISTHTTDVSALQNAIDKVAEDLATHAASCEAADEVLSSMIADEISARISADVELQEAIDKVAEDLATHAASCEAADVVLSGMIADEISARKAADKTLSDAISAVDGRVTNLSTEVSSISANHEGRLTSLEEITELHTTQISGISSTVAGLAGKAFKFVGTYTALSDVQDTEKETGNVVIVDNKEYVYVNGDFELLGDTGDFATADTVSAWISEAYTSAVSSAFETTRNAVNSATTDLNNKIDGLAQSLTNAVNAAQNTAAVAVTKADTAVATAGEANRIALSAKTDAEEALQTAISAFDNIAHTEQVAISANSAATTAQEAATAASQSAEAAREAALSAKADAEEAKTKADTATATADEAKTIAQTASQNATSAQTDAASALAKADTAVSTANEAVSTATAAIAHADALCVELSTTVANMIGDVDTNIGEAINDVSTALATETARSISVDSDLAQAITDLADTTSNAITSLSSELTTTDNQLILSVQTLDETLVDLKIDWEGVEGRVDRLEETVGGIVDTTIPEIRATIEKVELDRISVDNEILSTIGAIAQDLAKHEETCASTDADLQEAIAEVAGDLATHVEACVSADVARQEAIDKVAEDLATHAASCAADDQFLSGKISAVIEELSTVQKKITPENGLTGLTDGSVKIGIDFTQLSSNTISVNGIQLGVNIEAVTSALNNALTTHIASCAQADIDINTKVETLSTDVSSISTDLSDAISTVNGRITDLSNKVSSISADHVGRISTLEETVKGLTNATRFIGVAAEDAIISGTKNTQIKLEDGLHEIQSGDIVIVGNAEYIAVIAAYRNDEAKTPEFKWVQLGDESTCAKTLDLIQEHIITCELADVTLSNMVSTVSADLIELSTKFEDHVVSCEQADADLSAALSAEISARQEADEFLSGVIADEISARISSDAELDDKISAIDDRITDIEATLSGILILNGGNAFGW